MTLLRILSNGFIVAGYVLAGLFSGTIAGAMVGVRQGGVEGIGTTEVGLLCGALAGLVFGLRRCGIGRRKV